MIKNGSGWKNLEIEQILDAIAGAVICIDKNGTIVSFNHSAETMFGYAAEDIIGRNVSMLMPEPDSGQHDNYLSNYLETAEPEIPGLGREVLAIRSNGETFPMYLEVAELPETNGDEKYFIASGMDITEQKKREEQLRHSQKMQALGKLTGGIVHDYNNVLSVITGFADLLKTRLQNDPLLSEYVKLIMDAAERGISLTTKLLAFSSSKQVGARVIDLNALLLEEKKMLEKMLTVRVRLILDLCDEPWAVLLVREELIDAILNLSINALHAMPEGGVLKYSTRNGHLNDEQAGKLDLCAGDYVLLTVSDSGCGIDADILDRVFDPFFTTKGNTGTGLGLSQIYGFVQRSGGAIEVHSKLGHGTYFVIYFPRCSQGIDVGNIITSNYTIDELGGTETILLVDDEPALRYLGQETLIPRGYTVLCADNAQQALDMLAAEPIDLLLTDIVLPGIDGYALAARVQRDHPSVKIQLVSGYEGDDEAKMMDEDLFGRLLHKPIATQALLERVREVLDAEGINNDGLL